jgi:hypothetical protein
MSRFSEPQDPAFQALNTSLSFDQRLWPHDVAQSRAHATMLAARGSSPTTTATRCSPGSTSSSASSDGRVPVRGRRRGHPHGVERRLTEIAGPVGGKLHTARSRNDQVATDVALFVPHARAGALELPGREPDGDAARRSPTPPRLADARLHAPAARAARLPRPPPARLLLDARARRASASSSPLGQTATCRSAPARWPA